MSQKCPMCFFDVPADRAAWACQACPPVDDPYQARCAGLPHVSWPVITTEQKPERQGLFGPRWPAAGVRCRNCSGQATQQACPVCHYLWPDGWRDSETVCVALAGARNTGKSLYIGVLVQQVRLMLQQQRIALQHASRESQESYERHYEAPLFKVRQMPQATPRAQTEAAAQRHPLVLSMGQISGRRRFLVLRDAAGEELQNLPPQRIHLDYFDRADAIIFMFDPAADPDIAKMLPDELHHGGIDQGSVSDVLANVLRLSQGNRPPVGVAISKFDMLQGLSRLQGSVWPDIMGNKGAAMTRDPGVGSIDYLPEDAGLLNEEVHSLLMMMRAADVINQLSNPHDNRPRAHQYFAVSALGSSARDQRVHPHGIASFRCLDPLRWAMKQATR